MLNHSAGFNVCPTKMFQGHNPQILLHEANTIVSQTVDRLLETVAQNLLLDYVSS